MASRLRRATECLFAETAPDAGGLQRFKVRVACELRVQWFEPASCFEEKRRRLTAAPHVQGDLSLQPLRDCVLDLVQ